MSATTQSMGGAMKDGYVGSRRQVGGLAKMRRKDRGKRGARGMNGAKKGY